MPFDALVPLSVDALAPLSFDALAPLSVDALAPLAFGALAFFEVLGGAVGFDFGGGFFRCAFVFDPAVDTDLRASVCTRSDLSVM